jgi:putative adhesin
VEHDDTTVPVVRTQDFECAGPVDVFVELDSGRLDIHLEKSTEGTPGVAVQVRADPTGQPPWSAGIGGLLNWLGEQASSAPPGALAAEAVRRTVIDFTGQRLTVRSPRDFPLRTVPLTIEVGAPAGSSITARSGSADIAVDGVADRLDASTGSGQVRAQRCTGPTDVRTGSGDVWLGSVLGRLRVKTGSGKVEVISLEGAAGGGTVQTGSGDVRLGAVTHDMSARTGSGDLTVVDASAGGLELTTGSGQLRVGIHAGVRAELDVSSGSGHARSDLPVSGPPTEGDVALRVRARTGSGDALVTAAPS